MVTLFQKAVAAWDKFHLSEDEGDTEAVEAAETIILTHVPRDDNEALAMMKVLVFNQQAGERVDGLDLDAVDTLVRYSRRMKNAA